MQVQESIIHRIKKQVDTSGIDSVEIIPRAALLPIDNRVLKLGEDVLKLYGKLSNGYGMLGNDYAMHRFPNFLNQFTNEGINFIDFSTSAIALIAEEMSKKLKTTTSYPIFLRYTNQGRDWLLIAVLKLKEGVGIDEDTLDLNDSLSFDISNLREAARIDIEKWGDNEQPYLSFIKRSSGSDAESSVYFRDALSCLEYTDAKHNTETTIQAVNDYCEHSEFNAERTQATRARMFDYCREKKDADEPVNLTALSAFLNDQEPDSFINFVRERDYEVSETFSPNPASYKKLQRLSKRFGTINIGFDVNDIFEDRVLYNADDDTIIVRNPPEELVQEIRKATGEVPNGE